MLKVGTDCSGMEAPIQALKNLNIPFVHEFSSEIDEMCLQTIMANTSPTSIYRGDITKRDNTSMPSVDLYVCGFPCQPFSIAGHKRGFDDLRGTVFFGCFDYIQSHRPKYFVLENVRALLSNDEGKTWDTIWGTLRTLPGYSVNWTILNTKDYGVPQSRKRLYIVGIRDSSESFQFPEPCKECPSQVSLVDESDQSEPEPRGTFASRAKDLSETLRTRGACFVDILQYRTPNRVPLRGFMYATCLLCTSYVWCTPMMRWANEKELLRLQGYPDNYKIVVPHSIFRKQIGNTMSVNVLEAIFAKLLNMTHKTTRIPYSHSYLNGERVGCIK